MRCVEQGFALSEASHAPVMLELRIRACHVTGSFTAKDNRAGTYSGRNRLPGPPRFDYARLAHPPVTFVHERLKVESRMPAAQAFIRDNKLNEVIPGDLDDIGIIVMGGLTNGLLRALERLGLADVFGASRVPLLVLNVVYPLVPEELRAFCAGKRAVLVVEEGHPEYIEQAVNVELRRADIADPRARQGAAPQGRRIHRRGLLDGLAAFLAAVRPAGIDTDAIVAKVRDIVGHRAQGGRGSRRSAGAAAGLLHRLSGAPGVQRAQAGAARARADPYQRRHRLPLVRDHAAVRHGQLDPRLRHVARERRRGRPQHGEALHRRDGRRRLLAQRADHRRRQQSLQQGRRRARSSCRTATPRPPASNTCRRARPGRNGAPGMDVETTLRAMGVTWLRKVRTYGVAKMVKALKDALRSAEHGLKVIIADGECQLVRQRRVRAEDAAKLARGERVVRTRYGVDEEICTGDHSCIRLSGCPSLTVKPNPDPLRSDPVTTVIESCVGCGLCGEVAHAAVLCPSFYRAELIRNPTRWDRMVAALRRRVIGILGGAAQKAAGMSDTGAPHHPADRGARRRRRRRAHRLDHCGGGRPRPAGAEHLDPRRRPAHRRHHLLHRGVPDGRGTSSAGCAR